jgi:hypothetical protein
MEQRQEQGLGPGDVTLETVRTWMLWQTEVERRIGARFAGTLDRCPGGVRRSIGQSAAPCQKQNGTFRGVSGAYHTRVAPHVRVPPSIGRSYTLLQHTRRGLRTPDDRR